MNKNLEKATDRVIRSKKQATQVYPAIPSSLQVEEADKILAFADSPDFAKFEEMANIMIANNMAEAFEQVRQGNFNQLPLSVMKAQAYVAIFDNIALARSIRLKNETLKNANNQ